MSIISVRVCLQSADQKITVIMTIEYYWIDEFLAKADVDDYLSVGVTQIPAGQVWVPTLHLVNSGSDSLRYRPDPSDSAYLFSGGYVDIWITTDFTVGCELKLQKYIFLLE